MREKNGACVWFASLFINKPAPLSVAGRELQRPGLPSAVRGKLRGEERLLHPRAVHRIPARRGRGGLVGDWRAYADQRIGRIEVRLRRACVPDGFRFGSLCIRCSACCSRVLYRPLDECCESLCTKPGTDPRATAMSLPPRPPPLVTGLRAPVSEPGDAVSPAKRLWTQLPGVSAARLPLTEDANAPKDAVQVRDWRYIGDLYRGILINCDQLSCFPLVHHLECRALRLSNRPGLSLVTTGRPVGLGCVDWMMWNKGPVELPA